VLQLIAAFAAEPRLAACIGLGGLEPPPLPLPAFLAAAAVSPPLVAAELLVAMPGAALPPRAQPAGAAAMCAALWGCAIVLMLPPASDVRERAEHEPGADAAAAAAAAGPRAQYASLAPGQCLLVPSRWRLALFAPSECGVACWRFHPRAQPIDIFVELPASARRQLDGAGTVHLRRKPTDRVESLRDELHRRAAVPAEQLRLLYGGVELRDGMPLMHYRLRPEATLSLHVRDAAVGASEAGPP